MPPTFRPPRQGRGLECSRGCTVIVDFVVSLSSSVLANNADILIIVVRSHMHIILIVLLVILVPVYLNKSRRRCGGLPRK